MGERVWSPFPRGKWVAEGVVGVVQVGCVYYNGSLTRRGTGSGVVERVDVHRRHQRTDEGNEDVNEGSTKRVVSVSL